MQTVTEQDHLIDYVCLGIGLAIIAYLWMQ